MGKVKVVAKVMDEAKITKEGRMYFKDGEVYKVEKKKLTLGDLFPKRSK